MCVCVRKYTSSISKFCLLRSNDTIATMGTHNVPNLVSKYHSSIKGTRTSLEVIDFKVGAGTMQDEPEASSSAGRKLLRKEWGMLKGHMSQAERAPNSQIGKI